MNPSSTSRLAALAAGSLFLLSALAAQEAERKLVFREFAQVQQLRVVCSQRHFGRLEDLVVDVPSGRLRAALVTMQGEGLRDLGRPTGVRSSVTEARRGGAIVQAVRSAVPH